jgi:histidyl-tRNA synthetase
VVKDAPSVLDSLDDEDRAHFEGLQSTLDALGTPYRVEPGLVRGLDYYTRTLFEIRGRGGDLGAQSTLCGGGRYDEMIGGLGGNPTPAIGFGMGLERVLLAGAKLEPAPRIDVFVVAQKPEQRAEAVQLAREVRESGLRVDADLRGTSMKSQMRRADKSGARFALVLGEREVAEGTVQVKHLGEGTQHEVARALVLDALHGAPT